ncbi:single hybrid motif-containing protein [Mycena maculata]|uniref:Single hybrid motif-containing protein n=1 Tax=Mycena maculata TaxID=230809 RepID=A0AAD7NWD7_9AGAR|nr:single hybrid motif-containing protein [Mycena maculata]
MSPFMTEGTIRHWAKKEGDTFRAGDVLLQIESDCITIDIEAENPGVIGKILLPEGSTNVPVEQVIALVAKTPQELANMPQSPVQMRPPTPVVSVFQHHRAYPHSPNRAAAGLEHPRSPMMTSVHRTASVFESLTHDPVHSGGVAAAVRGIAMDHTGLQHHTPVAPEVQDRETEEDDQVFPIAFASNFS